MMAIALALLLQTQSAQPVDALRQYLRCSAEKAVQLIVSKESADVISGVAQRSCEPLIDAAAAYVDEQGHADPVIARYEARNGRRSDDGVRAQLLEHLRESAMNAVVETKAKLGRTK